MQLKFENNWYRGRSFHGQIIADGKPPRKECADFIGATAKRPKVAEAG